MTGNRSIRAKQSAGGKLSAARAKQFKDAQAAAQAEAMLSAIEVEIMLVSIPLALFCLALWLFLPCAFGVCGASALPAAPAGSHWTDCDALDGSGCAMLPDEALALRDGAAPTCIRVTKMATTDRTVGGAVETANGIVCAVTASPGDSG